MTTVVLGLFKDVDKANDAVAELKDSGYDTKNVSIMVKDNVKGVQIVDKTGESVVSGTVSGATTGGALGAIAGLLIGVGAIAVPGIGALLIGGPIALALGLTGAAATTVSGAVTGALAGGLVGGLTGLGIPEKEAQEYEKEVEAGGVLIAVPARTESDDVARSILEEHGATQVRSVPMKFAS